MNNTMVVLAFNAHTDVAKKFAPQEYVNSFILDGGPMHAIVLGRAHMGNTKVSIEGIRQAIGSRTATEYARVIFGVRTFANGEYLVIPYKDSLGVKTGDVIESIFSRLPRVYPGRLKSEPFLNQVSDKTPAQAAAAEIADLFNPGFCNDDMVTQFATIIGKHFPA